MKTRPTYRIYDRIGRHVCSVTAVALILVIGLAVGGSLVALAASLLVLPSLLVIAASRTETVEVPTEALEPAYAY